MKRDLLDTLFGISMVVISMSAAALVLALAIAILRGR